MTKKHIPVKIQKKIFQEAGNKCSFCSENDVNVLEIHHIYSVSQGGGNEPENLILVCSNCHSKISNGLIPTNQVIKNKYNLVQASEKSVKGPPSNIIKFDRSINQGVVASKVNTININTTKSSKIKIKYPEGSIGSELNKRNYIHRLIKRYNDLKKSDKSLGDFKYAIIYKAIEREFKAKWDFIPLQRFNELVEYLHFRIDNTIVGKMMKRKGQKRYSTYDEFLIQQK